MILAAAKRGDGNNTHLVEHSKKLVTCLAHTVTIVGIDHENESLCVLEVMAPQGADLVLSSHIPHSEADILVLHCLNVEPCTCTPHTKPFTVMPLACTQVRSLATKLTFTRKDSITAGSLLKLGHITSQQSWSVYKI